MEKLPLETNSRALEEVTMPPRPSLKVYQPLYYIV